ncbi:MAG: phosphate ABC transporter substrate-binding protein PstS [Selenomonadales bacterium]|nr:phosphate ABC transporter substrate-binding protein PstS [Selenomonadales bacterium]
MRKHTLFVRVLAVLACLSTLVSLVPAMAVAQTRPIAIVLDGREIRGDAAPQIIGGRTMVPMRLIFEALGAEVTWTEATQTVGGRQGNISISLIIGNRSATVGGRAVSLDQPAQIIAGRTFVPVRFVAESLGATVEWDEAQRTVRITSATQSRMRSPVTSELRITAGGASFPFPLYTRLITEYAAITSPRVQIEYASVGSGAGIRGILARTFDFAGTDAPMTAEQQAQVRPNEVLHIPTVMGAVAVVYNLGGIGSGLRLTPGTLADIYLGRVTNWNDPSIRAQNPTLTLPDQRITLVRRSDSSGTTFIFTNYLSKVSAQWRSEVGEGTTVRWPGTTIGGAGNAGVAAQVSQIPGAIGYVELSTAVQSLLSMAHMQNRSGNFIAPSVEAATAAALIMEDSSFMTHPTDSVAHRAYPIVGITWILVYRDQDNEAKARAIVDFLRWAIVERNLEPFAAELHYSPLTETGINRVRRLLQSITFNGQPVWR